MHGLHRTLQHRNGDFHWFLRTRFCRVVAQIVIMALLLVDVPVPTGHQTVAEATGSSSFQPRILALAPSCVARGANFKIILANFDRTSPLTVKVGGALAVIVSTTTLSSTTKKLVVTMPQTATPGRTTVIVSNNKPQSASKIMRVRQTEICGNGVDDDCNGKVDDRDASGKSCPIVNRPPVANAGPDQTRPVGATVRLTACGSSDRDGDRLSFSWSFVAKPTGSAATLKGATTSTPTFVIDKPGAYTVKLTVNDGRGGTATDTVVISTTNSKPVANAGPDQSGQLGTTLTLDGSASFDADGNPLTYQWSLVSKPAGSTARLVNPTAVQPTLTLDKAGDYVVQLIVHDGKAASAPDTVVLSTQNSKPVANAGADQTVGVNETVQLDGSGSNDADGDPLTYQWSFAAKPDGTASSFSDQAVQNPTFVPDTPGLYVVQLIVRDGQEDSDADTASVTVNVVTPPPTNKPPVANAGADQSVAVGATVNLSGNASSDPDGDPLTFSWQFALKPENSTAALTNGNTVTPSFEADVIGTYTLQLTVNDGQVNSTPDTVTITVTDCLPDTTQSCYSGPAGTAGVGICKAGTQTCNAQGEFGACVGEVLPKTEIPDNGIDEDCNGADEISAGLPPDPTTVAPPVAQGVATTIGAATQFLYTGTNPIQTGVAPGTIEPERAAVIRGKVLDRNNAPLSGVKISILNHPEFGQTLSRTDGMFDLAVNGGGLLSINYDKTGFLPSQRQLDVPWQDFLMAPDVVLISKDTHVTTVDLTASVPMQVAQGSVVTDSSGTRQARVLIPQGTQAQVLQSDGTPQPVNTLNIRLTEYTVGPNGPATMPGELPPTSGYTYALELGADEAIAKIAGKDVLFSQPVFLYSENFLNFPIGLQIPVAYYNKDTTAWIPVPDGRIIKILSTTGGLADLDTDGDGAADNDTDLGIIDAERQQLASLYSVGQSLWRIPVTHFSTYDL